MMPSMMAGYPFLWVLLAVLFCLAGLAAVLWLLTQWLKSDPLLQRQAQEPHTEYRAYEQGYQPEQQTPETAQEGGQRYSYPQYEQSQVQYQEREQL